MALIRRKTLSHPSEKIPMAREKIFKRHGDAATRALILVEDKLTLQGLAQLVGGDENLYVYSKLEGFRVGDENGDSPYLSNSWVNSVRRIWVAPLTRIQRQIGISEGEFS